MIILSYKPGQLGNSLVYFSHFIAFGQEMGIRILNPAFWEYSKFFTGTRNNLLCSSPEIRTGFWLPSAFKPFFNIVSSKFRGLLLSPKFNWRRLKAVVATDMKNHFILSDPPPTNEMGSTDVIFPHGYFFRDPKNIIKHKEVIHSFFCLCSKYNDHVEAVITVARKNCDLLVGIHIRQGDYKTYVNGKYFYSIHDYAESMKGIEKIFAGKKITFLVCSDGAFDKHIFKGFSCTFAEGNAVEDMYSLSRCDYIAGPPSSFSAWAAFCQPASKFDPPSASKNDPPPK